MWIGIAIGGALGALARYGVTNLLSGSPLWSMVVINSLGCLILGFVLAKHYPESIQLSLTVGFCGAFTTFSSWIAIQDYLIQQQAYWKLLLFLSISLFSGFGMLILGKYFAN